MRREGFEPPTSPLSTECSASELTSRPIQLNHEGTKRARTLPLPLRERRYRHLRFQFTSNLGTATQARGGIGNDTASCSSCLRNSIFLLTAILERRAAATPRTITAREPPDSGPTWDRTTVLLHVTQALLPLSYRPDADVPRRENGRQTGQKADRHIFPAELERRSSFRPGDSRPRGRELSELRRAQNVIAHDWHLVPGGESFEMANRFLHASNL
jgi:hypothetical protein